MDKIGYWVTNSPELGGYSVIYGTRCGITANYTTRADSAPDFCTLSGPYDSLKEAKQAAINMVWSDTETLQRAACDIRTTTAKELREDYRQRREETPPDTSDQ